MTEKERKEISEDFISFYEYVNHSKLLMFFYLLFNRDTPDFRLTMQTAPIVQKGNELFGYALELYQSLKLDEKYCF